MNLFYPLWKENLKFLKTIVKIFLEETLQSGQMFWKQRITVDNPHRASFGTVLPCTKWNELQPDATDMIILAYLLIFPRGRHAARPRRCHWNPQSARGC